MVSMPPQVPFWFMDSSPCWIKSETTELVFAASLLLMQYNTEYEQRLIGSKSG
jgi:hypothetical protein